MTSWSVYIMPMLMAAIIITAFVKKVPLYDTVLEGAGEGMQVVWGLFPTMVLILTAVSMFQSSGAMELLIRVLSPLAQKAGIPAEILPMALMRPISGSGALGVLADNLKTYGADSRMGLLSSVVMGATETTFYTLAVYFGATRVKKSGWVVPCALIGDLTGLLLACRIIGGM